MYAINIIIYKNPWRSLGTAAPQMLKFFELKRLTNIPHLVTSKLCELLPFLSAYFSDSVVFFEHRLNILFMVC